MVKTDELEVRCASADDDLSLLLGNIGRHTLALRDVFVAVSTRGVEGMVVIFDSGHSVIYADHFVTRPDAPKETGPQLVLAVNRTCQAQGKTAIFLVTNSVELAYIGKRRGAQVEGPLFRIRYDVTDVEGAKHA